MIGDFVIDTHMSALTLRIASQRVSIRPARLSDAARIARVHVESWRATYATILPAGFLRRLSVERDAARWMRLLSKRNSDPFVLVAEDRLWHRVVGFAQGGRERTNDRIYRGELHAIYLLPDYQRRGIGATLTSAVADRLLAAGIPSMLVWVLAHNSSRRFYETLGGRLIKVKKILLAGKTLPAVAYGWKDLRALLGLEARG
jgi:ribosomal protein S18 acetylase RimI-like enzyme